MLDFGVAFRVRDYLRNETSLDDVWSDWEQYATYQEKIADSGLGYPGPLWFVMGSIHSDWTSKRYDEQMLRVRFQKMLADFGIKV
jgi:hypothetical protein